MFNKAFKSILVIAIIIMSLIVAAACIDTGTETTTYTVTFNSNGGTDVESITIAEGTIPVIPSEPTKEGYTFDGWFLDNGTFLQPAESILEENIASNIKVYALWATNQYSITFHSNEGSPVTTIMQDFDSVVVAPINPTRTAYTFVGWYTENDLINLYVFDKIGSANINLYADWLYTPLDNTLEISINDTPYGSAPDFSVDANTSNGALTYLYKALGSDESSYSSVLPTSIGSYTAKVTSAATDVYKSATMTVDFDIVKAPATIGIASVITTFTYTGDAYFITGVTGSGAVSYENNSFTDAGEHTVTVNVAESANNMAGSIPIVVTVEKAAGSVDTSLVITTFTYSGMAQSISGATGSGEISYVNNSFNHSGNYTVTVIAAESANYLAASVTVDVIVDKATYNMSTAVWNYTSAFTYNGDAKSVEIIGYLPYGITVNSYINNSKTNVGSYTASVVFDYNTDDFYEPTFASLDWTINKATHDMSAIAFNDITYKYDGEEKSLVINGQLPTGVEVSYSENTLTEVGSIAVTADFTYDTDNFNEIPSMTATLTIDNKLTYDMSGVSWDYIEALRYNGSSQSVLIMNLPAGVTVASYINNVKTNAGTYTANVIFNYNTELYYEPVIPDFVWIIEKNHGAIIITASDILFGQSINISLNANISGGAITYEYKELGADDSAYSSVAPTAIGSYTVRATSAATANYTESSYTDDFSIS
ncbi:MAG: hypothetical protein EOM87_00275 [Clostridia bacterium]|nr:hypothetical protein [Clostridia bacterium]